MVLQAVSFKYWHQKTCHWVLLNYALIIAKYEISVTNVNDGILDFECFLLRLCNKIAILHDIATKNKRLDKFKKT